LQQWLEPVSATGKFGQDTLESSQNLALRSCVSSRSLENTRNLNTSAKINMIATINGIESNEASVNARNHNGAPQLYSLPNSQNPRDL